MIPTISLFNSSSDEHTPPQGIPRNLIYFLKAGTDPKEYIERVIVEAYPDWKFELYQSDGLYTLQKPRGRFTSSVKRIYVEWEIFNKLTIVTVKILTSYGNVNMDTLAFAYSFDEIIRKSEMLIKGYD